MTFRIARLFFASIALLGTAPALAADLPASILKCTAIPDDKARLACFDRAVAPRQAVTVPAAAVAGGAAVGATGAADAAGADAVVEVDSFKGVVKTVQRRGVGLWVLVLEDGSTWDQSDTTQEWFLQPGDKVELSKARLGSWFVRKEGRNATLRVTPARR